MNDLMFANVLMIADDKLHNIFHKILLLMSMLIQLLKMLKIKNNKRNFKSAYLKFVRYIVYLNRIKKFNRWCSFSTLLMITNIVSSYCRCIELMAISGCTFIFVNIHILITLTNINIMCGNNCFNEKYSFVFFFFWVSCRLSSFII